MSEIQYNLQFEKLCKALELGDITCEPKAISGGLLHRMFEIKTTQGKYAIKALNPQIMRRPAVIKHIIQSELIANIASNSVPAVSANKYNGVSIQETDNQFYLVFDWVDGKNLKQNEISRTHCEKIAEILATIHMTDFSGLGLINEESSHEQIIDWSAYLEKGKEGNSEWTNLVNEVVDKLYEWNDCANKAAKVLGTDMIISHRDLDSKNVMWDEENPIIIDWESAGYVNPMQEFLETAIYWSEEENGKINKGRFTAFINSYMKKYGELKTDWKMVLASGFSGKLGWLEYNLKRSLLIECTDKVEQQMGTEQVIETIKALKRYSDMVVELEEWLNNR